MTPQIEKQISELLELMKNGAESLPPYLQTLAHQAVISELVNCSFFLSVSLITLAASSYYAKKFWKKHSEERHDLNEVPAGALTFIGVVSLAVGLLAVSGILSCLFTPDLVAFKALRGLIQ